MCHCEETYYLARIYYLVLSQTSHVCYIILTFSYYFTTVVLKTSFALLLYLFFVPQPLEPNYQIGLPKTAILQNQMVTKMNNFTELTVSF